MDASTSATTALPTPDRIRHLQELVVQCQLIEAQLDTQGFPRETRRQLEHFYKRVLKRAEEQLEASSPNHPLRQPLSRPSDS